MSQKSQSPGFLDELKAIFSPKSPAFTHSPSLLDFYAVFVSEKALLSAEVQSYEKVYGKNFKPYTVYNIKIKTKTHEFRLAKRYSDFLILHQKLKKQHPHLVRDWHFPEKTMLWGNFSNELLETRKQQFQEYLDILIQTYGDHNMIEFLDFLEIQKILHASNRQKTKNGIVGAFGNEETSKSAENTDRKEKQNISEGIENEKAFQFLWNLNYSTDNYITVFNEYEAYFLNSKPKMNIDGIKRLLLGDKALRGLIEVCGNISNPNPSSSLHTICSKAFKFLAMLLDHEYNKEAEIYIKIYKSAGISMITSLKLGLHIKANSQKPCKSFALKLLDLYLSHNLEKAQEILPKVLEGNEEAAREYDKWKMSKRFSSISVEQFEFTRSPSEWDSAINPMIYLSFNSQTIKKKTIPLTKWLPIVLKEPKYSQFKSKHLNEESLKISTTTKAKPEDCFEKFTNNQSTWDTLLVEETRTTNEEIFIEKFKWWKDNPEGKTFVFINKRSFDNNPDKKIIKKTTTPFDYQLNPNEVLLNMTMVFNVKKMGNKKKALRNIGNETNLTKINVVIKELSNETKNELSNELKGAQNRFIDNLASFKSFVEGTAINL